MSLLTQKWCLKHKCCLMSEGLNKGPKQLQCVSHGVITLAAGIVKYPWAPESFCLLHCDLLQGESFIIHAMGTTISDCSSNNNPVYTCKAAPSACPKMSGSCPWLWLFFFPCQKGGLLLHNCFMLRAENDPSVHTSSDFFPPLLSERWHLHNILIEKEACRLPVELR